MGFFKIFRKLIGSYGPVVKGNCEPRAFYQLLTLRHQKHLPVRIVVKVISDKVNHVQGQVFFDNEWQWTTQINDEVLIGKEEFPTIPPSHVQSLEEHMKEQLEVNKEELKRE